MEIIDSKELSGVTKWYKGYSSAKKAVKFESVKYMLRVPTEKEYEGVAITHGVANYLYNRIANLLDLKCENVKLVTYDNIITSMCRDFEVDTNSRLYTLQDIAGVSGESDNISIYGIISSLTSIEFAYNGNINFQDDFLTMLMLDYLTGNFDRRLTGYGILVSHNMFVDSAPIFGGAMAFGSGLRESSIRDILVNHELEDRLMKKKFKYMNDGIESSLDLYDLMCTSDLFISVIDKFKTINMNRIIEIIDSLTVVSELTKEYVISLITCQFMNICSAYDELYSNLYD